MSDDRRSSANSPLSEAARIEGIWGGEFGNAYVQRNPVDPGLRQSFWQGIAERFPVTSILEVGCNLGANLRPLVRVTGDGVRLAGIDINATALGALHGAEPSLRLTRASGRALPFADGAFDFVFTVGVLIHQPPELLPLVMDEIQRCSRRFVMCAEYYAPDPVEVPYRGQTRALFKADFGGLYARRHGLQVRETDRLLGPGWDDVTYWVLEKDPSPR
ncbi:MAG: pseudaminic acid biosynthesis-associated methylase [Vicinamibacterales bacterium]